MNEADFDKALLGDDLIGDTDQTGQPVDDRTADALQDLDDLLKAMNPQLLAGFLAAVDSVPEENRQYVTRAVILGIAFGRKLEQTKEATEEKRLIVLNS